jgi:hypothetical protein
MSTHREPETIMSGFDGQPCPHTRTLSETERAFIAALARWSANADYEKAKAERTPTFGARLNKVEGMEIIEHSEEGYDERNRDST